MIIVLPLSGVYEPAEVPLRTAHMLYPRDAR